MSGLFHIAKCPPAWSMFLKTVRFPFLSWLNNSPLCIYTFSSSVYPLIVTCVVSISWILWVMDILQVSLWDTVSFPLAMYPQVGIAGLCGSSTFSFWGTSILSSIMIIPIYIPTNSIQRFFFLLHPHKHLVSFVSWWQPFQQMWHDLLWLQFAFPWWLVISIFLSRFLAICMSSFENM